MLTALYPYTNHFNRRYILFKVSENVVNHQFYRYVESLGWDAMNLTAEEEETLRSDMMRDLYPGKL